MGDENDSAKVSPNRNENSIIHHEYLTMLSDVDAANVNSEFHLSKTINNSELYDESIEYIEEDSLGLNRLNGQIGSPFISPMTGNQTFNLIDCADSRDVLKTFMFKPVSDEKESLKRPMFENGETASRDIESVTYSNDMHHYSSAYNDDSIRDSSQCQEGEPVDMSLSKEDKDLNESKEPTAKRLHTSPKLEENQTRNTHKSTIGSRTGQIEIKKMTDIKSRACDECRRRKTACYYLNSENSKCFRCQMEKIDCTFSTNNRSAAQNNRKSTGVAAISQRQASKQHQPEGLIGPVEDYSQLPGRSLLRKTLSLQHPRSSFAIGQHGLWDQRVLENISLDKSNQASVSSNLSLRKVGPDSWFMIRNEGGQSEWVRDCDEIERTIYPYGRALVNAFFMYIQPEYPLLHEKIFVEKYLRTYRELMPALLGSVYYLGMRWWNHSTELSTVARPDHIMPKLYDLTLTNFFKSSGGSSLSLIQAGLLLLQCSYSDPRHLSICSVINSAALRLALNRNCLHWKLPRWEINLRLRLSWAIYTQSTWISLFESIPPLIYDSSWFLPPLNADMFDTGSNEPILSGALFIHLNRLSLIVHEIHNLLSSKLLMMYSSRTSAQQACANNENVNSTLSYAITVGSKTECPSSGNLPGNPSNQNPSEVDSERTSSQSFSADAVLEMIKPIQIRLHEWKAGLPVGLLDLECGAQTGSFTLKLAYIAAEITLHRFLIRAVYSKSAPAVLDPEINAVIRSSARERLEMAHNLLKNLKPQHFHQFWFFASSYHIAIVGVFAALMYTTSDSKAETEYYWYTLKSYVEQIKLFSDHEVMAVALRTLRSSIAGVPGLMF